MVKLNNSYGSGSHGGGMDSAQGQSADELMRQNKAAITNIQIEKNEDGTAHVMGIPVPQEMIPIVEPLLQQGQAWIIDNDQKLYQAGVGLSKGFKIRSPKIQRAFGLVLENFGRWGTALGAQAIFAWQARGHYSDARKEIHNFAGSIEDVTGINKQNNSVIKEAYDDASRDYGSEMKLLFADLPVAISLVGLAIQKHRAAHEEHAKVKLGDGHEHEHELAGNEATAAAEEQRKKENAQIRREMELDELVEKQVKEARDAYAKAQVSDKAKGRKETYDDHSRRHIEHVELTEEEWKHEFDYRRADKLRDNLRRSLGGKSHDDHDDDHEPSTDKKSNFLRMATMPASLVSQALKIHLRRNHERKQKIPTTLKMIETLVREVESQCGGADCSTHRSPDEIMIHMPEGGDVSLKEYIVRLFQQNERSREPNKNWVSADGHLINPLGAPLVAKLQPAVDMIAEYVADGRLDARALTVLVGGDAKGEKVIVHTKGGVKKFASEDEVRQAIEALVPVLGTREVQGSGEFLSKFEDPKKIENAIKENIDAFKGKQKAVFAAMFPDDVLEQFGVKKKGAANLRKDAHPEMEYFVAASAQYLSGKGEEYLKKLGLGEKDIQAITELAGQIESGDKKALQTAIGGRDKRALDAVRTAGLLEQTKNDKKFWYDRFNEIGGIKEKLKNAEKTAKEETVSKEAAAEPATTEPAAETDDKKWTDGITPRQPVDLSKPKEGEKDESWSAGMKPNGDKLADRFPTTPSASEQVLKERRAPDSPAAIGA